MELPQPRIASNAARVMWPSTAIVPRKPGRPWLAPPGGGGKRGGGGSSVCGGGGEGASEAGGGVEGSSMCGGEGVRGGH